MISCLLNIVEWLRKPIVALKHQLISAVRRHEYEAYHAEDVEFGDTRSGT